MEPKRDLILGALKYWSQGGIQKFRLSFMRILKYSDALFMYLDIYIFNIYRFPKDIDILQGEKP